MRDETDIKELTINACEDHIVPLINQLDNRKTIAFKVAQTQRASSDMSTIPPHLVVHHRKKDICTLMLGSTNETLSSIRWIMQIGMVQR